MNPPQSPHKNTPAWPLEQAELWAAAAEVLTSAPHFSQLGWKAGLNITAVKWHCHCYSVTQRPTAVCTGRVSASSLPAQICVASIAPAGTVLANWAALEEPRGVASTQPCQGLCCLCSYCLLLEICLVGYPVGDFWPRSWQSFCFTKDHATGPCRHPSVRTMCCLWARMEISHCWKAKILDSFSPSLWFHETGIAFFFFSPKLWAKGTTM